MGRSFITRSCDFVIFPLSSCHASYSLVAPCLWSPSCLTRLKAIETRKEIVDNLLAMWPPPIQSIKATTLVNSAFRGFAQPFLFQHINLQHFYEALELFKILQRSPHLPSGIRTLTINLDLEPDDDNQANKYRRSFWRKWKACVPSLTHLHSLSVAFSHTDKHFLARFIDNACPQDMLVLKKLSFMPLDIDYDREKVCA